IDRNDDRASTGPAGRRPRAGPGGCLMADETMRFFGDAELVRYLDGELDEQGRARLESAIAAAPAVQARLEQLRRRGEALRERLREADPHVPERLAANPFRNGAAATA